MTTDRPGVGPFPSEANRLATLAADARRVTVPEPVADSLDAAWAEAEALVPAGYRLDLAFGYCTVEHPDWLYHASCRHLMDYLGYIGLNPGGPTPAAALRALAAALRERQP